jgi:hypothetical protein
LHATSALIADIKKDRFFATKFSLLKLIQRIFFVLMGNQKHHFHATVISHFLNETDCNKPVASVCVALLCNMEAYTPSQVPV